MNKNILWAFLGGALAGGITAWLLAPRSGEETRTIISNRIKKDMELNDEDLNDLQQVLQHLQHLLNRSTLTTTVDSPDFEETVPPENRA
ncbi:MAG: YtxH domain-containing protein [Bacteroidales bacterium]|jgi:gas vesicle protein|nr:YtxH domain-containing protein [Bacteroidales bacterium]